MPRQRRAVGLAARHQRMSGDAAAYEAKNKDIVQGHLKYEETMQGFFCAGSDFAVNWRVDQRVENGRRCYDI